MIGRTNTGGGGMSLNFKVVPGLTQPVTASENTIWVKVEAIGDWYFSATQPENLRELDVWILVNEYSPVEFNALKKNGIQVYPVAAKQRIGGELVEVDAMSYQGGTWVEWITDVYLYDNGDECVAITGGWSIFKIRPDCSTNESWGSNQNGLLTVQLPGSKRTCAAYGTNNAIDVTDYATIEFSATEIMGGECLFGVLESRDSQDHSASAVTLTQETAGTVTLDISNLSGRYYIWFGNYTYDSAGTYGASIANAIMRR